MRPPVKSTFSFAGSGLLDELVLEAGVFLVGGKPFVVQAGEITDVERHQDPTFTSGILDLFLV